MLFKSTVVDVARCHFHSKHIKHLRFREFLQQRLVGEGLVLEELLSFEISIILISKKKSDMYTAAPRRKL